jgi:hypothetical protein
MANPPRVPNVCKYFTSSRQPSMTNEPAASQLWFPSSARNHTTRFCVRADMPIPLVAFDRAPGPVRASFAILISVKNAQDAVSRRESPPFPCKPPWFRNRQADRVSGKIAGPCVGTWPIADPATKDCGCGLVEHTRPLRRAPDSRLPGFGGCQPCPTSPCHAS